MLVDLKILLRNLILPPAAPLLAALLGSWLLARAHTPRLRRSGWVLLIAGIGSLWLLSTPVIASWLVRSAQRPGALDLSQPVRAQAIVILGGRIAWKHAPEYDNAPAVSSDLLERLAYGALLAQRTALPVLVSGTGVETDAMRASLARNFGVPVRWAESHSRDTYENAQFSAAILRPQGITRVLLVTSAVHEERARAEFTAAGLEVEPAPVRVWAERPVTVTSFLPSSLALLESTDALYELIGDVVRRSLAGLHLRRHDA